MNPEEERSDKGEGTRPKDTPNEDSDKVRGELFKRMFPDLPILTPDQEKKFAELKAQHKAHPEGSKPEDPTQPQR